MAGFHHPQILELLTQVRKQPTYPMYQRISGQLGKLEGLLAELAGPRRVRTALLSSFTIDPVKPYLQMKGLERDVWIKVFLPGFNQFVQQILEVRSELYDFKPDVCFLHVLPEALIPGQTEGFTQKEIPPALELLRNLVEAFRRNSSADLVVSNFSPPGRFPYAAEPDAQTEEPFRALNEGLRGITREISGVTVLDYQGLAAYHGREAVADERLRHIARMELSDLFLPKLANQMLAALLGLRGLGRKCIVFDLDNILWGGIVGEEGPDGILLGSEYPGSAYREFQQALWMLHQKGILLAVNSKNNEADVFEVLKRHPAMILRPEHFASIQINWQEKWRNMEAIAEELQLGLESMVFIDDSPAEREMMRCMRPEVLTPEWPSDMVYYRAALESLPDFTLVKATSEDLRRGEVYAASTQRKELKKHSGSMEEYLFGLKMELAVQEAHGSDLARVHQLIQKTNQFNLTTRRYSAAEVEALWSRQDAAIYVLRNWDIFGDNGLIGVAILVREKQPENAWRIDSLLMSCRVLGRTIETGFLSTLIDELKCRGGRLCVGEYIPTAKNALVKDFYPQAGFSPDGQTDESCRWVLDLVRFTAPHHPWLRIHRGADLLDAPLSASVGTGEA